MYNRCMGTLVILNKIFFFIIIILFQFLLSKKIKFIKRGKDNVINKYKE